MNFNDFNFDESTKQTLQTIDTLNRMPHAIIIESKDKEKSLELASFLSMWAVCTGKNKPCGICEQCHKAKEKAHADIKYAYPEKKSKTYSIDQMRDILKDSFIRPNEANAKVYIFEEADNRLSAVVQNSLLKLLEEPPQNVFFILLCENSKKLLITILSRCVLLRIKSEQKFDKFAAQSAKEIVHGILSAREYELLKAVNTLCDKEKSDEVLSIVKLILRDGLAILSGADCIFDEELGKIISTHMTKSKILEMIELTEAAKSKITQNININLLATWLCGEYRRISWQR